MTVLREFIDGFLIGYRELTSGLSFEHSSLLNVFIFALVIALYSVFTFKFYKSLSKKDLIDLNLGQYNRTNHPFANKLFATILYLLEYIIILPFLIFFWFAILAIIILVLSNELIVSQVIIVSAAVVSAVRILSYYDENLSQDLAKIFPFTILAIFLINPSFFSIQRIASNIPEIPGLVGSVVLFLILIIAIELILRFLDLMANLFRSGNSYEGHERDREDYSFDLAYSSASLTAISVL